MNPNSWRPNLRGGKTSPGGAKPGLRGTHLSFITLALLILLAGCAASFTAPKPDRVVSASEGLAGVVAHTESAERHVRNAIPHADATGKVQLSAASDEHKAAMDSAGETKAALVAVQQQADSLRAQVNASEASYAQLEDRWYVRWGRRIEKALWTIGIAWLVLGVCSVVLGLGNPLGWGVKAGKEIVRAIPGMNPFAWVRDWLLSRRQGA